MSRFDAITQYIPQLKNRDPFAAVVREAAETGVTVLPTIEYTPLAKAIVSAFYEITESCEEYSMDNLLAAYDSSPFAEADVTKVDVSELDAKYVLALIATVLHMERWDNGTLHSFYHSGKLLECLERLKQYERKDETAHENCNLECGAAET